MVETLGYCVLQAEYKTTADLIYLDTAVKTLNERKNSMSH